ncbi:hypothetical protein FRC01_012719, partial [Tulasnella sp. 417]
MSYMSAWATFTSSFPSVENDIHYASMTPTHAYHQPRTPESPQQYRYPQPGGPGRYVRGPVEVDD